MPAPARWFTWTLVGVVMTGLLLAALGPLSEAQMRMAMRGVELPRILPVALGLVGLGILLGVLVTVRKIPPLVPGIMALLLAVFYGYPLLVEGFPGWPTEWLQRTFLLTLGTLPYFLTGILAGVTLWRAIELRQTATQGD